MMTDCGQVANNTVYTDILVRIDRLPPLPFSLQRLLGIMQDENAAASDLETLIHRDEALCGKILRIANSAFYGPRSRVKTLSRAIMTIGLHEVKSICLFSLLLESFPVTGQSSRAQREKLWKHALMTAKHAAEIVRRRPWVSVDEAYDLGLLHDLGWLAMLVHFQEEFQVIQGMAADRKVPLHVAEEQSDLKHTQVGKWIALRWALPEVYHRVMLYHHAPEESPTHKPVVKMLLLAHHLAQMKEYPELADSESVLNACRDLRIPGGEWQLHLDQVETVRQEADSLWRLLN